MKFATVSKSLVMGLALLVASSAFAATKGSLQLNNPVTDQRNHAEAGRLQSAMGRQRAQR